MWGFMKKSDLKTGMIVEYRGGQKGIVLKDSVHGDIISSLSEQTGYLWFSHLHEDLTAVSQIWSADIVKIYESQERCAVRVERLLWERQEIREVTMKEVCEKFGEEVKIIKGGL